METSNHDGLLRMCHFLRLGDGRGTEKAPAGADLINKILQNCGIQLQRVIFSFNQNEVQKLVHLTKPNLTYLNLP